MSTIQLPTAEEIENIVERAMVSLRDRMHFDERSKTFLPKICATCDRIHILDNPVAAFPLNELIAILDKYPCKWNGRNGIPSGVQAQFQAEDARLKPFILSRFSRVVSDEEGNDHVEVCKQCSEVFKSESKKKGRKFGPSWSIWNGSLFGDPPECLACLNEAELNLISLNRFSSNAIVLRSDSHKGLYGWHSIYQSEVDTNVSNIQLLAESGFNSDFICVLCGPFSKLHLKKAKDTYQVRSDRVLRAFEWLKVNNPFYKDIPLPSENQLTSPRLVRHSTL